MLQRRCIYRRLTSVCIICGNKIDCIVFSLSYLNSDWNFDGITSEILTSVSSESPTFAGVLLIATNVYYAQQYLCHSTYSYIQLISTSKYRSLFIFYSNFHFPFDFRFSIFIFIFIFIFVPIFISCSISISNSVYQHCKELCCAILVRIEDVHSIRGSKLSFLLLIRSAEQVWQTDRRTDTRTDIMKGLWAFSY